MVDCSTAGVIDSGAFTRAVGAGIFGFCGGEGGICAIIIMVSGGFKVEAKV
jgi:hypothetical protein